MKLFDRVRLFLSGHDFHESASLIPPKLGADYKPLGFVATLNKVLEIYTITGKIGDQH